VKNKVAFQPTSAPQGALTRCELAATTPTRPPPAGHCSRCRIPSRYVRGTRGNDPGQAKTWLGVDDARTAGAILTTAGLDGLNIISGTNVLAIRCTRVWVEAYVPYGNYRGVPNDDTAKTWIPLDPALRRPSSTRAKTY